MGRVELLGEETRMAVEERDRVQERCDNGSSQDWSAASITACR